MSYTNLIDSNLRKAFNILKDLAIDATFVRTNSNSFNFATGQATAVTTPNIKTKVVIFDGEEPATKSNLLVKQLLVKAKDVGNIKVFDKVDFESVTWNIGPVIKGTGFIYVIEVFREA